MGFKLKFEDHRNGELQKLDTRALGGTNQSNIYNEEEDSAKHKSADHSDQAEGSVDIENLMQQSEQFNSLVSHLKEDPWSLDRNVENPSETGNRNRPFDERSLDNVVRLFEKSVSSKYSNSELDIQSSVSSEVVPLKDIQTKKTFYQPVQESSESVARPKHKERYHFEDNHKSNKQAHEFYESISDKEMKDRRDNRQNYRHLLHDTATLAKISSQLEKSESSSESEVEVTIHGLSENQRNISQDGSENNSYTKHYYDSNFSSPILINSVKARNQYRKELEEWREKGTSPSSQSTRAKKLTSVLATWRSLRNSSRSDSSDPVAFKDSASRYNEYSHKQHFDPVNQLSPVPENDTVSTGLSHFEATSSGPSSNTFSSSDDTINFLASALADKSSTTCLSQVTPSTFRTPTELEFSNKMNANKFSFQDSAASEETKSASSATKLFPIKHKAPLQIVNNKKTDHVRKPQKKEDSQTYNLNKVDQQNTTRSSTKSHYMIADDRSDRHENTEKKQEAGQEVAPKRESSLTRSSRSRQRSSSTTNSNNEDSKAAYYDKKNVFQQAQSFRIAPQDSIEPVYNTAPYAYYSKQVPYQPIIYSETIPVNISHADEPDEHYYPNFNHTVPPIRHYHESESPSKQYFSTNLNQASYHFSGQASNRLFPDENLRRYSDFSLKPSSNRALASKSVSVRSYAPTSVRSNMQSFRHTDPVYTQYSNQASTKYSNQPSTYYSNRDSTQYSNRDSTQYSNRDFAQYSIRDSTQYSYRVSPQHSYRLSPYYINRDSTQYSTQYSNRPSTQYSNRASTQHSNWASTQHSNGASTQHSNRVSTQHSNRASTQHSNRASNQYSNRASLQHSSSAPYYDDTARYSDQVQPRVRSSSLNSVRSSKQKDETEMFSNQSSTQSKHVSKKTDDEDSYNEDDSNRVDYESEKSNYQSDEDRINCDDEATIGSVSSFENIMENQYMISENTSKTAELLPDYRTGLPQSDSVLNSQDKKAEAIKLGQSNLTLHAWNPNTAPKTGFHSFGIIPQPFFMPSPLSQDYPNAPPFLHPSQYPMYNYSIPYNFSPAYQYKANFHDRQMFSDNFQQFSNRNFRRLSSTRILKDQRRRSSLSVDKPKTLNRRILKRSQSEQDMEQIIKNESLLQIQTDSNQSTAKFQVQKPSLICSINSESQLETPLKSQDTIQLEDSRFEDCLSQGYYSKDAFLDSRKEPKKDDIHNKTEETTNLDFNNILDRFTKCLNVSEPLNQVNAKQDADSAKIVDLLEKVLKELVENKTQVSAPSTQKESQKELPQNELQKEHKKESQEDSQNESQKESLRQSQTESLKESYKEKSTDTALQNKQQELDYVNQVNASLRQTVAELQAEVLTLRNREGRVRVRAKQSLQRLLDSQVDQDKNMPSSQSEKNFWKTDRINLILEYELQLDMCVQENLYLSQRLAHFEKGLPCAATKPMPLSSSKKVYSLLSEFLSLKKDASKLSQSENYSNNQTLLEINKPLKAGQDNYLAIDRLQKHFQSVLEDKIKNEIQLTSQIGQLRKQVDELSLLSQNTFNKSPEYQSIISSQNKSLLNTFNVNSFYCAPLTKPFFCLSDVLSDLKSEEAPYVWSTDHSIARDKWLHESKFNEKLQECEPAKALQIVENVSRNLGVDDFINLPTAALEICSALMYARKMNEFIKRLALIAGNENWNMIEEMLKTWRTIALKTTDIQEYKSAILKAICAIRTVIPKDIPQCDMSQSDEQLLALFKDVLQKFFIHHYNATKSFEPYKSQNTFLNNDIYFTETIVKRFMEIFDIPNVSACHIAIDRLNLKMKELTKFYRGVLTILKVSNMDISPAEVLNSISKLYREYELQRRANDKSDKHVIKNVWDTFKQIQTKLKLPSPPYSESLQIIQDTTEMDLTSTSTSSAYSSPLNKSEHSEAWKNWSQECMHTVDIIARLADNAKAKKATAKNM